MARAHSPGALLFAVAPLLAYSPPSVPSLKPHLRPPSTVSAKRPPSPFLSQRALVARCGGGIEVARSRALTNWGRFEVSTRAPLASGRQPNVKTALSFDAPLSMIGDGGSTFFSVLGLLSFSAFFSLSETSITTLWPWKIRELAMQEGRGSPFYSIRQDISRLLTSLLIGNTFANIAATAVLTQALKDALGPSAVALAGVLILLFCEIMPKAIAVRHPVSVARAVVYPLSVIALILYPLGKLCTIIATRLLKLIGMKEAKMPFVSELELRMVLSGAEKTGEVTNAEADMVENVLELGNIEVEKVMTPLVEVTAVDVNASLLDMWHLWKTYQYSRVPVYSKRVDNIVGIAFPRDLVNFIDRPDIMEEAKVTSIMEAPPLYVPEGMTVRKMLQEFQTRNLHIAVVVNEYGGVVGLVTMEDVLEEIVGEIFDETDALSEERQGIRTRNAGVWDVTADTPIRELEDAMGVKFPETQNYETVAGFVLDTVGAIPTPGVAFNTTLPLQEDDNDVDDVGDAETAGDNIYRFLVVKADPRSVQQVRIEAIQSPVEAHGVHGPPTPEMLDEIGYRSLQLMAGKSTRLDRVKARKARIERLFENIRADGIPTNHKMDQKGDDIVDAGNSGVVLAVEKFMLGASALEGGQDMSSKNATELR